MCVTLNLVYTPEYFISSGISGGVSYSYGALSYLRTYVQYLLICFDHHFYFPAQLVGGFTLSDLLDKPWSQVSPLLSPGTCLQFLSCIGFSIPTARRFSSNVANSRSRAFRQSFFYAKKSPYEYAHSVRIELAKLILVGTRITYQATGDAGYCTQLIRAPPFRN